MNKKKRILLLVLGSLFFAGAGMIAYVLPYSLLGPIMFRAGYSVEPVREEVLEFYTHRLDTKGRGLPMKVESYLLRRLETTTSLEESELLLHHFVELGKKKRWDRTVESSFEIRRKLVDALMDQIRVSEGLALGRLFDPIEQLRRGNLEGFKTGFHLPQKVYFGSTDPESRLEIYRKHCDELRSAYLRWWGDGTRWPENQSEIPYQGTSFEFQVGP